MTIEKPKCIDCIYYNKNDYDKISCKKFKEIPKSYLLDKNKCKDYKTIE